MASPCDEGLQVHDATTTVVPMLTATPAAASVNPTKKQCANVAMVQVQFSGATQHCPNKFRPTFSPLMQSMHPLRSTQSKSAASTTSSKLNAANRLDRTKLAITTKVTLFLLFSFAFLLPLCCSDRTIEKGDGERRAKKCAACSIQSFDQYKQMRQEQILSDILKRLDLPAKPNVTIDYGKLSVHPIVAHQKDPRVRELIEESIRESISGGAQRRAKRSTSVGVAEGFYPALYETDAPADPAQTTFIVAEKSAPASPLWFISDDEQPEGGPGGGSGAGRGVQLAAETAFFSLPTSLRRKYTNKATPLNVFVRQPEVEYGDLKGPAAITIEVYERHMNGTQRDVQGWLQRRGVVALHVRADFAGENLAVYPGAGTLEEMMFLELEVFNNYDGRSPSRHRRNQAATNVCTAADQNETQRCCLYDLPIDFAEVGWNFVIAPKRYNAYICNGECSVSQMASTARGSVTHQANLDHYQCCHPKEYAGITIAYVTSDNMISVKEVPGMVARRCGCA